MSKMNKLDQKTSSNEGLNNQVSTNKIMSNEALHNEALNNKALVNEALINETLDKQAKYIVSMLDGQSNRLSMRTIKQLENARESAVKAHGQLSGQAVNADGTLSQTISWAEHHRLATAGMVLVAVTAGFLLMQSVNKPEYSDAFLLGSDLPPEAFVDRGFAPSLNIKQAKI